MDTLEISRRRFAVALAAGAAGGLALPAMPALGQGTFPSRTVKIYVGASSGGAPDATARAMAKILGEAWGQSVVVDNRPGVSGLLAAESTAQAPPDGHTLALLLDSVMNTVPLMNEKMPMDPIADLKAIGMVGSFPLVLVAHPSVKYRDLKGLAAAAKAQGSGIDYASSGLGSSGHLAMETFASTAGIKMNHVPYKGGIPALQDVLAGHVPMIWGSVSACAPQIQSGKVVALGIGSSERFPLLPDVATAQEQGFAGFTAGNWMGLFGPAAMPNALVQKIHADLGRVAADPGYRKALLALGIETKTMAPDALARQIRAEYARNKELFPKLGIGRKS